MPKTPVWFWQYLRNSNIIFDFDKLATTLQPSRNEELCHFHIAYFSFFDVRNLKAVEGLFMFSVPKFYLLLFYLWKEVYHQLITFTKCSRVRIYFI